MTYRRGVNEELATHFGTGRIEQLRLNVREAAAPVTPSNDKTTAVLTDDGGPASSSC